MGMLTKASPAGINCQVLVALAVVVMISTTPVCAMPRAEKHEVRHQIERLESAWRSALLHGNTSAMDGLLADDYMAITPNGILQSKDQALASLRSGTVHITALDLSDRKIRLYGATALVTSRAEVTGTDREGDMSGAYRYTRVYVKDPRGAWRIVSFEASKIRESGERRAKAE